MSSLYVVQQGTRLQKDQGRFVLKPPTGEETKIPMREIKRILVFGNVQLSNSVISTCLQLHIPVVFLSQLGKYKGQLWSAKSLDLAVETAQFKRQDDTRLQLETARAIVRGKLLNSKLLLQRLNRKRQLPAVSKALAGLTKDIRATETAETLEALRGYEGIGAARYFPALGASIVHPDFSFQTRNRQPPRDPVNSMLSFGYTLLFSNVFSLLLAEGCNPYLGNLHRSEKPNPELAMDLMEEFRSPIVDSLVLRLVNKKTIKPSDFTRPDAAGGVYLTEPARRIFLKHFDQRITDETAHPDLQTRVSYRRAIQLQIQRYKRCLLQSTAYEAFVRAV